MTEREWLDCREPELMLAFLLHRPTGIGARLRAWLGRYWNPRGQLGPPRPSDRKLRLFACACCGLIANLLWDSRSRDAVAASERYADGKADAEELEAARLRAWEAVENLQPPVSQEYFIVAGGTAGRVGKVWPWAARAAAAAAAADAAEAALAANAAVERAGIEWAADGQDIHAITAAAGSGVRAKLVRDMVGNPFRPLTINPARLTPGVTQLARTVYDEQAFDRLPELANALAEVGCTDEAILGHCRGPGPHVRGCRVVDAVLGKV